MFWSVKIATLRELLRNYFARKRDSLIIIHINCKEKYNHDSQGRACVYASHKSKREKERGKEGTR